MFSSSFFKFLLLIVLPLVGISFFLLECQHQGNDNCNISINRSYYFSYNNGSKNPISQIIERHYASISLSKLNSSHMDWKSKSKSKKAKVDLVSKIDRDNYNVKKIKRKNKSKSKSKSKKDKVNLVKVVVSLGDNIVKLISPIISSSNSFSKHSSFSIVSIVSIVNIVLNIVVKIVKLVALIVDKIVTYKYKLSADSHEHVKLVSIDLAADADADVWLKYIKECHNCNCNCNCNIKIRSKVNLGCKADRRRCIDCIDVKSVYKFINNKYSRYQGNENF